MISKRVTTVKRKGGPRLVYVGSDMGYYIAPVKAENIIGFPLYIMGVYR